MRRAADARARARRLPCPSRRAPPARTCRSASRSGGDVERADEHGQVLAGLHRAEREDVPVGTGERAAASGVASTRPDRSLVDAHDPVGVDAEVLTRLAPDEVADGMDRGAAVERPPEQAVELQRRPVAHLGVVGEGEVVHRDDDRRPRGRGDERGAVHHVDAPGPALDARHVGAQPQPAGQSRGERPRRRAHRRRQHARERFTAAPRDGVPDGVEVGPVGEAGEQRGREARDAGAGAEQRSGVDRDPERRRWHGPGLECD